MKLRFSFRLLFPFLLLILFLGYEPIRPQSDEGESSQEENPPVGQKDKYAEEYESNCNFILDLLTPVRDHRENYKDTEIQKKKKQEKREAALAVIKKAIVGKAVTFKSLQVMNVDSEKTLSANGIRHGKDLMAKIKNDPQSKLVAQTNGEFLEAIIRLNLAFCSDCWKDTGRYIVSYEIPIPKAELEFGIRFDGDGAPKMSIYIKKIFPNENQVLEIRKDSRLDVTGKVKSISYTDRGYDEDVGLILE
ncbi:hypothetical protein EHO61_05250 [Leptospira fluminis]|uniref:Uncharacterized protein n=1 Tax=Leptospira fluminis TaxID=2484979 RepID=A0A4R9GR72_9LEPT|nr:hypothetical protein [Leptospira fluminis]TGK20292.1 hypothetical protein EHO61_05250 [Leptospira fluminis]